MELRSRAVRFGPSKALLAKRNLHEYYCWAGVGTFDMALDLWSEFDGGISLPGVELVDSILPEYGWKRVKIANESRELWDWKLKLYRLGRGYRALMTLGASSDFNTRGMPGSFVYDSFVIGIGVRLREKCRDFGLQYSRDRLFFDFGWLHLTFAEFARGEHARTSGLLRRLHR